MSGETMYEAPRKPQLPKARVHDYLYDSSYIVSGARDYARTSFKAAMASAQLILQPVYNTMFSELRQFPRMHVVYHPNCRLPDHMDRSYGAYLNKVNQRDNLPTPQFGGKDRFKFCTYPKKVLDMNKSVPDFHPPSPVFLPPGQTKPKNRGTQSIFRIQHVKCHNDIIKCFRESSAQTIPWQPDSKPAENCAETPEVLYLDQLQWGPGKPFRIGDLPADFHTTEIINKMRHARKWNELTERGDFPRWMKKRDDIINDVETKDWIFREAEIDELQDIRLELLHRLQSSQREKQSTKTSNKLANLWAGKKELMHRKIDTIRRSRDRELRKLQAIHQGGGRMGLVAKKRAARAMGPATFAAFDPTSDVHAPLARHGYQARGRHADITYDPSLLVLEDHIALAEPPPWLETCGQNLHRTCSGHHLPKNLQVLCERETKWSEQFLENLHNDLKKARLGAASASAGPLHVLKPRKLVSTPRPTTPQVESVSDSEELSHQSALVLQKIIRGRAVQLLMYEGRTRAAELTEELKTTHGLQMEDKIRIAKEEAKARDYNAIRTESEQKDDAISALVDELCGGAVSAALDFLEKELRRLKEERRQHAFILIALREKQMREAAEAGRRQKEEHRRREHDEMFKQVLGVTQDTVDAYLRSIIREGVQLGAEQEAVRRAQHHADKLDAELTENQALSTAEQNEMVAELVQQFLLPDAHKTAARHRIASLQQAKMDAARETIFGLIDEAGIVQEKYCTQCGCPLDELCRCRVCLIKQRPVETSARDDPRWKHSRRREGPPSKSPGERYPPQHEFRCMLNTLIDEVVVKSRCEKKERQEVSYEMRQKIIEGIEMELEVKDFIDTAVDRATGVLSMPVKERHYYYTMRRVIDDAMDRTEPYPKPPCPQELPSAIRRDQVQPVGSTCLCDGTPPQTKVLFGADEKEIMLPSALRALEELKRCKCDTSPSPSRYGYEFEDMTRTYTGTSNDDFDFDEQDEVKDAQAAAEEKKN